jgi:hypothetical protein
VGLRHCGGTPELARRSVFPIGELCIAIALIVLIALGLYFFTGAWGIFLLWCLALVFVLPQVGVCFALFIGGGEELDKERRAAAAGYFLCALLWGLAWLAGVGYCAYSGYQAYRAIP